MTTQPTTIDRATENITVPSPNKRRPDASIIVTMMNARLTNTGNSSAPDEFAPLNIAF